MACKTYRLELNYKFQVLHDAKFEISFRRLQMFTPQESLDYLRSILSEFGELIPYGSRTTGLALAGFSDIDIAIFKHSSYYDDYEDTEEDIEDVCYLLKRNHVKVKTVFPNATAPLVRVRLGGLRVDLVFKAAHGVVGSRLISDILKSSPKAKTVILGLKKWAYKHDLIGADQGKLSSHALTLFAIDRMIVRGFLGTPRLNTYRNSEDSPWHEYDLDEMAQQNERKWTIDEPLKDIRRTSTKDIMIDILNLLKTELTIKKSQKDIYGITRTSWTKSVDVGRDPKFLDVEDPISRRNAAHRLCLKHAQRLVDEIGVALERLRARNVCWEVILEGRLSRHGG